MSYHFLSSERLDRRRFLMGMGALMAAGIAGPLARWAPAAELKTATQDGYALGSGVRITALHADAKVAAAAGAAALRELEQIDQLMSIYRRESQVSVLNRTGRLASPDGRVLEVLQAAQQMAGASGGAFDVTVQPLWAVQAERGARGPTAEELAAARAKVGWKRLRVGENEVTLEAGMAITLNGIAQGYAADRAVRVLREHGIEHALINTGEFAALGRNEKAASWRVGLQHPRNADAYVAVAALEGRALATSGDYATRFDEGYDRHHIFDPATGESARQMASVSVVAASACTADALSTAIFVMGSERGLDLVRRTAGAEALIVGRDGSQRTTGGFPLA